MMRLLLFTLAAAGLCFAEAPNATVRGKLALQNGKPVVESKGSIVWLEGDEQTMAVLKDKRLAGSDLEVKGQFRDKEHFAADHFHHKSLFVHKDGKRQAIT